jgi:hypothetical protein
VQQQTAMAINKIISRAAKKWRELRKISLHSALRFCAKHGRGKLMDAVGQIHRNPIPFTNSNTPICRLDSVMGATVTIFGTSVLVFYSIDRSPCSYSVSELNNFAVCLSFFAPHLKIDKFATTPSKKT